MNLFCAGCGWEPYGEIRARQNETFGRKHDYNAGPWHGSIYQYVELGHHLHVKYVLMSAPECDPTGLVISGNPPLLLH